MYVTLLACWRLVQRAGPQTCYEDVQFLATAPQRGLFTPCTRVTSSIIGTGRMVDLYVIQLSRVVYVSVNEFIPR